MALALLGLLTAALAWTAAPPARGPVRLTAQQQKHVDRMVMRAIAAAGRGDFEDAANLCGQVAEYRAKHQGARHHEAIEAALKAEQWRRLAKVPAKDRAEVLRAWGLNVEAVRLVHQGKYREAEKKARDALAMCEKALGEAHPDTARSYNNVASSLQALGKASEALPLYKKALAISEKALGQAHPDTALSYNNVAYCLQSLGKASEALPLYKKALASREKALGEAHPDTAQSYNNLAYCLQALGKASEALPLYKKALAIREKALGEAHPDTAISYHGVALCLKDLGKASEALPVFKKALAICEKALGEAHPHTAISYNNVASSLRSLGKASEALPLFKKALAILEKALGEAHPDTAQSYNNVAGCLWSLGKASEALPLHKKALAIFKNTLGEAHPDTALSCHNVAYCLQTLGKASEALPLYKKALAIRENTLGEAHPDTAQSSNNLANCLQALGKASEALPLYKKALAIHEKALGEAHPSTGTSYNNVAFCLKDLGKASEALPLHRKALAIHEKALGEAHPETATSYNNLAFCLLRLGKYAEASRAFRSAALGREVGRLNAGHSGFDRSLFQANVFLPREGLAACLVRQGKAAEAWAQAEADLARGLLEDLNTDRTSEDREGLTRIQAINARLMPLLARQELDPTDHKLRDALLGQRANLEAEMAKAAVERSNARTLPLWRIQKQIPTDAAIVLWLDIGPLDEHLGCVVRGKGEPAWVRLPGTGKGGEWTGDDRFRAEQTHLALIGAFLGTKERDRIVKDATEKARPYVREALAPGQRERLVKALFAQRLAPLEKHLEGVRRLLVVSTGRMAEVPVEALTDRYTVSYIPSGSVFARCMEQHRMLKGDSLLVLADPAFKAAPPPEPPAAGVLLSAVVPGGSAARAGLRPGDVLLRVGKTRLESLEDLDIALKQPLPLEVLAWRDGENKTFRLSQVGRLGVAVDRRSAPAAVRAWRREQARLVSRGGDWQPLPGTRVEAEVLKGLISNHTTLEGKDATEKRLERLAEAGELKRFRLLHLATHGEANTGMPTQSALILAQHRPPDAQENLDRVAAGKLPLSNRLTVEAILRTWTLDADLVTLSACQSGVGADAGGEGMLGFAQALLQKGARSVLLSRWKVDDAATALLMLRFYQKVLGKRGDGKKPLGRAEALHEAKRWLRTLSRSEAEKALAKLTGGLARGQRGKLGRLPDRKEDAPRNSVDRPFEHPYYWAAFVLIGDPDLA
jgi:CHAT domain-containing protein/tetratricopeptide (TPR) repeat protein